MREQIIGTGRAGATRTGLTLADLRLKIAEHIIAHDVGHRPDEVWSILAETKVGAWRRRALEEKLRMVFSTS